MINAVPISVKFCAEKEKGNKRRAGQRYIYSPTSTNQGKNPFNHFDIHIFFILSLDEKDQKQKHYIKTTLHKK